jgi:hypothetical protein
MDKRLGVGFGFRKEVQTFISNERSVGFAPSEAVAPAMYTTGKGGRIMERKRRGEEGSDLIIELWRAASSGNKV